MGGNQTPHFRRLRLRGYIYPLFATRAVIIHGKQTLQLNHTSARVTGPLSSLLFTTIQCDQAVTESIIEPDDLLTTGRRVIGRQIL